jgi:hypothetical protein
MKQIKPKTPFNDYSIDAQRAERSRIKQLIGLADKRARADTPPLNNTTVKLADLNRPVAERARGPRDLQPVRVP